ncbi:MAG: hypothetical protein P8184_11170 [Calditrichia bacterium]
MGKKLQHIIIFAVFLCEIFPVYGVAAAGSALHAGAAADSVTTGPQQSENPASENEIHFITNTGIRSLEITQRGTIRFSRDNREIAAISPDGYFSVKERRWFRTRRLEVVPGPDGKPEYRFYFEGRAGKFNEHAKDWLAGIMPEVSRRAGINLWPRINESLLAGNTAQALRLVAEIESNTAKKFYYIMIADSGNLNITDLQVLIRQAGREVDGSQTLGDLLGQLAVQLPPSPVLTGELLRSAEEIASSSRKKEALIKIARLRKINVENAVILANSIKTIASSSNKQQALSSVADLFPANDEAIDAYLQAARSISSSANQAGALLSLISRENLSVESWRKIAMAPATIASSSEQGRVLRAMSIALPSDDSVIRSYLKSAEAINSSQEKASAISILLDKKDLSDASYIRIAESALTIASSGEQGRVLEKTATTCPVSDSVMLALLKSASEINSSSEQERVFLSILDREGLSKEVLLQIVKMANSRIAASGARDAVINRAAQAL